MEQKFFNPFRVNEKKEEKKEEERRKITGHRSRGSGNSEELFLLLLTFRDFPFFFVWLLTKSELGMIAIVGIVRNGVKW